MYTYAASFSSYSRTRSSPRLRPRPSPGLRPRPSPRLRPRLRPHPCLTIQGIHQAVIIIIFLAQQSFLTDVFNSKDVHEQDYERV